MTIEDRARESFAATAEANGMITYAEFIRSGQSDPEADFAMECMIAFARELEQEPLS